MNNKTRKILMSAMALTSGVCILAVLLLGTGQWEVVNFLLTQDQAGFRYYKAGEYDQAESLFQDPLWKGIALFKKGEFKKAAGFFAGSDTSQAAFNHGNALVMQGKYQEAVERYDRALALKPGWEDAAFNRELAMHRAEMLKREGGDMTGGQMGADEIVFTENKNQSSGQEEQTDGGAPLSDAELRAVWLRNVQTKPADFLRAKFAYQHARGKDAP